MDKIHVAASSFSQEPLEILKENNIPFAYNQTGKRYTKEGLIAQAKDCVGVVAGLEPYDAEVINALFNLKFISRCGVGLDNIDMTAAEKRGIKIFNTPDAVTQPVAELTIGLIFDLLRNITMQTKLLNQNQWKRMRGFLLAGKVVGLIGLGRIGKKVAQMLTALQADVIAVDPYVDQNWAKDHGIELCDLSELLSKSDIVTLHLSADKENQFCLRKDELFSMKPGAFLINVARGEFVDEEALYNILSNGHLLGAALDVFEQEPYAGPLTGLEQVILTPHIGSFTKESRCQMETESIKHLVGALKE